LKTLREIIGFVVLFGLLAGCSSKDILDKSLFKRDQNNQVIELNSGNIKLFPSQDNNFSLYMVPTFKVNGKQYYMHYDNNKTIFSPKDINQTLLSGYLELKIINIDNLDNNQSKQFIDIFSQGDEKLLDNDLNLDINITDIEGVYYALIDNNMSKYITKLEKAIPKDKNISMAIWTTNITLKGKKVKIDIPTVNNIPKKTKVDNIAPQNIQNQVEHKIYYKENIKTINKKIKKKKKKIKQTHINTKKKNQKHRIKPKIDIKPKVHVKPNKKIVTHHKRVHIIKKRLVVVDNSQYFIKHKLGAKISNKIKSLLNHGNTDIIVLGSGGTPYKELRKLNYRGTENRFFLSKFSKIIKKDFVKKYSKIIYFTAKKVVKKPYNIKNIISYRYGGGKIEIRTIPKNCTFLGKVVDSCRRF